MTTQTVGDSAERNDEAGIRARIRDAAIEQFGRRGFDTDLQAVAEAAGVPVAVVIGHFGSPTGLREACDDYIAESIGASKSEALRSTSPAVWFGQLSQLESYAPMMTYLVRSMLSGGELGFALLRQMIDNAAEYLDDGVRAGTVRPSRDPKGRARFLAMSAAGGFLLYLQMHDNPTDMAAVLRDYDDEVLLPSLELYTFGLLTDTTMYKAMLAHGEAEREVPTDRVAAAG